MGNGQNNKIHQPDDSRSTTKQPGLDILWPNIMQVINHTMHEVINNGKTSEKQVAKIIAKYSARWPVCDEYLSTSADFIVNICKKARQPTTKTPEFQNALQTIDSLKTKFLVFHHGNYNYYPSIPDEVLSLKDNILFWADFSKNELYSKGKPKKKWPEQIPEKMLCFLCHSCNSGKIITFDQLYSHVWNKTNSKDKIRGSIEGAATKINRFAGKYFITTTSNPSVEEPDKVLRIRRQRKYKIGKNVCSQLCMIYKA